MPVRVPDCWPEWDVAELEYLGKCPVCQSAERELLHSRFEGFGLVLVEALWAGTRVISTDCDFGPAELLEDGRYGVLVPPEDAGALAEAMRVSLHAQPAAVPDSPWFNQFLATTAADQHVALIEAELARC